MALVIVAVLVIAVLAGIAVVLLSAPAVVTLVRVELSAARTTIDQRQELLVTAKAIDTAGADRTTDTAFTWSGSPAGRASVAVTPSDDARANVLAIQAGALTVSATATLGSVSKTGNLSISINALRFDVSASKNNPDEGEAITLTVQATYSANGSVATSYRGEVTFSSDDLLASLPANYSFTASDAGRRNFVGVVLGTSGLKAITVGDRIADVVGSASLNVQRPPNAPAAAFVVTRTLMRVDVDASTSTDPENDIVRYDWDWENDAIFDATGVTNFHRYTVQDAYTIRLRVTDSRGLTGNAAKRVSVGQSTIDYEFYDFFNVPYGEWWDLRLIVYGDLPMNADCFSAAGATAAGACRNYDPANTVRDFMTYPYTNWWPLPGPEQPSNPLNSPFVYAPYRSRAKGVDVPGYNLSEPVFLPVFNYSAQPGNQLTFDWYMNYLDVPTARSLSDNGCGTEADVQQMDGYELRSQISLTMDLQESRRIFGVETPNPAIDDVTEARNWWAKPGALDPDCFTFGTFERKVEDWFVAMGNTKYQVANSYEFPYGATFTNMSAFVDDTGTTSVTIDHSGFATEVLLARWFYWGNASYEVNHLDSTKRLGWWDMELAWFEDFRFQGSLKAPGFDFTLTSAMHYHFWQTAFPGLNGLYDQVDDIPYWTWGPILTDYLNDFSPAFKISELDRYPDPPYRYIHTTPGGRPYGQNLTYDYPPIAWNLKAGQTWHFQFPNGNVVFFDPETPLGTDPTSGGYLNFSAPLKLDSTLPANFHIGPGEWDPQAFTWDVLGPTTTGGPEGSPGLDGIPGNSDDRYPFTPWGAIIFVPGTAGAGAPAEAAPPQGSDQGSPSAGLSIALPGSRAAFAAVPVRSASERAPGKD